MAGLATPLPPATLRRGTRYWLASYRAVTRWHLASLRIWVLLLAVVQVMAGAGFVLGIGLFFEHIPASAALFVSTGVPVFNLITVGLILGPQLVAQQKLAELIRAGLTQGLVADLTRSYLILLAWTVVGWAMTAWIVGRRK
jgi:hypothetical protein